MLGVSIINDDPEIDIKPEKISRRKRNEGEKYRRDNIYDI